VISGNPPRCHDEFGIASVFPPPVQDQLFETTDAVVDFLEHELQVYVLSACLSPLGLALLQFTSPVTLQSLVNRSPFFLENGRELVIT
jgi:hypothetical protein